MWDYGISLTPHAETRMNQRAISRAEIAFVLAYGSRYHSGGVLHRFLRRCDIPPQERRQWEYLAGMVVVLDSLGETVITTYKNRKPGALRAIRSKDKRDFSRKANPTYLYDVYPELCQPMSNDAPPDMGWAN